MIQINDRKIGPHQPTYIIAEMSANHNQNFDQAVDILKAIKESGADAVKIQTYTADTLTIDCDNEHFQIGQGSLWEGQTLHSLYQQAYTPWDWQPELQKIAIELGLDFFSTAFDESAIEFLETLNVPIHKTASFEIVDLPLIEAMGRTGKPIIISTGMASLGEIEDAVQAAKSSGAKEVALLKCTSAYPAPPETMNLQTIPNLSESFGLPVGLSDHTLGIVVPVAAVALGACIVEKHFTLSRELEGPDAAFSLEPQEFKAMVDAIRVTEKALGQVHYGTESEEKKSEIFRRSLFAVEDIKAGETFTKDNVRSIRPGYGLPPKYLNDVIGCKSVCSIKKGTPLDWNLIDRQPQKML